MACQHVGAALAVLLFPIVGPLGSVTLRLVISSLILLAVCRPTLRGHNRFDWVVVAGFGLALAAMNSLYYESLERLPLGAAVTIEFLGPLALSVIAGRRASSWLWAAMALGGVVLLGHGDLGGLDPVGVAFALAAGVMWAIYIELSAQTGKRFAGLDGLALAMSIGAVVMIPVGAVASGASMLTPPALLFGAGVAVLSSAIPYGLELLALRSLPPALFSILLSLSPAVAAITGAIILHQALSALEFVAIGLVVLASIGAVAMRARSQARVRIEDGATTA